MSGGDAASAGGESADLFARSQIRIREVEPSLPGAADYFTWAAPAILEMFRQSGPYVVDEHGMLCRGVVIRHLMLPGGLAETKRVIDWVAAHFAPGEVLFSLMSQYTPIPGVPEELNRRVRQAEYRAACAYMADCGIDEAVYPGTPGGSGGVYAAL